MWARWIKPIASAWLLVLFAMLAGAYWYEGRTAEAWVHGWGFVMTVGLLLSP